MQGAKHLGDSRSIRDTRPNTAPKTTNTTINIRL
jgi:hypothetical protein